MPRPIPDRQTLTRVEAEVQLRVAREALRQAANVLAAAAMGATITNPPELLWHDNATELGREVDDLRLAVQDGIYAPE